ncbi:MAG: LicD family protein [Caryophanon sp.]|nr:LicD family protein [Caryophanon sp.]
MEQVIIFGAGEAGKNFILHQKQYNILAVVDNDTKKHGMTLEGISIISPLKLSEYTFDKIVITSMYFNPIYKQLVEQLNIESSKIVAAHKNLLKEAVFPFEDERTLAFAKQQLKNICTLLDKENISYFLDYGTLLGIVREQELIKWDDDIDLSFYKDDLSKLELLLIRFVESNNSSSLNCEYMTVKDDKGDISSLVLAFKDEIEGILKFNIDFWMLTLSENLAIQTMNKCDKKHFLTFEYVEYDGEKLKAPAQYEEYLTHTYGDWRTPRKETTFADYPYAFEE